MKMEYITTPEIDEICTAKSEYDKLKIEQSPGTMTVDGYRQPRASASPDLAMSPQGQDGQTLHPSYSDDGKHAPASKANKGGAAMKDEHNPDDAPKLTKEIGMALNDVHERAIEIDIAKYQKYLDDPALTESQKEEIVKALWSVITGFMDLGFGVQPMKEVCGKAIETVDQDASTDSNDPKPTSKTLQNAFDAASDDT